MKKSITTTPQSECTNYVNDQHQHFMQMAEEYIKQKKGRETFYLHQCSTCEGDNEFAYYHAYTDEQAARIKQTFIDLYNAGDPDSEPVNNVMAVFDDINAYEFEGENDELDAIVFNHVNEQGVNLNYIDFDNPCHLYRISCHAYNERDQKLCAKRTRLVRLPDEDYTFILANQLKYRRAFNFNRLLMLNAPLAQKINEKFESIYYDDWTFNCMPFFITLDEAIDDALIILGQEETWESAYEERKEDGTHSHVLIFAAGHTMHILKETIKDSEWTEYIELDDIDADAVQQLTGSKDYIEMVDILCRKYNTANAFDDLHKYLDENNISYTIK